LFEKWHSFNHSFLKEFVHSYIQGELEQPDEDVATNRGFKLLLDFDKFKEQILVILLESYPSIAWVYRLHLGSPIETTLENLSETVSVETNLYNQLIETAFGNLVLRMFEDNSGNSAFPAEKTYYNSLYTMDLMQYKLAPADSVAHPIEFINKLISNQTPDPSNKVKIGLGYLRNLLNLNLSSKNIGLVEVNDLIRNVMEIWIQEENISRSIVDQENIAANLTTEQMRESIERLTIIVDNYSMGK